MFLLGAATCCIILPSPKIPVGYGPDEASHNIVWTTVTKGPSGESICGAYEIPSFVVFKCRLVLYSIHLYQTHFAFVIIAV